LLCPPRSRFIELGCAMQRTSPDCLPKGLLTSKVKRSQPSAHVIDDVRDAAAGALVTEM